MNIKGISDNFGSDPVGRASTPREPKPHTPPTAAVQGDDQVDMSKLSTLMARSAKDLEDRFAARQEKVDPFRDDLNTPPNLSDEVIDAIWRRMLGL